MVRENVQEIDGASDCKVLFFILVLQIFFLLTNA